ncbi:uncharacterized protein F5891DRAFT_982385 [Suillus fuscotomentosus]|uniref:Uncharacterized protein n=1 Tax=Suillus fuscotomentosus TaxID=1912939 RepID=A0AAD4E0U1_9AGAM|nr:uncharacterized protein F5891DRAFT_982385 [Suillus fuscotomentosus]KAG1897639.1 hypothetical protein F5891DRAFT_982385 [Suillus fuscotomentosus]
MSHSYRDVFQTFPAYRKGSPPVTSDADRSLEFPRRNGSQYRPKLKCQSASQAIDVRSDGDKETSSLPLVWETRYDVLVCAGRLSWEIPYSSGTSFMRQDAVISKYHINHGLEQALTYHQDIPENAYNSADNHNKVDNNQRSATPDPDPAIVASHTRARSYSTHGLSSKESLDVDILKARDTFVPLKSPLELTEQSRSLPPRARRLAESSFDARAELGTIYLFLGLGGCKPSPSLLLPYMGRPCFLFSHLPLFWSEMVIPYLTPSVFHLRFRINTDQQWDAPIPKTSLLVFAEPSLSPAGFRLPTTYLREWQNAKYKV